MKPVLLFSLCFIITIISCRKQQSTFENNAEKAISWMWSKQHEDGGWHSETHTVLRDGKVLTPYILFHLLKIGDTSHQQQIDKAIGFIIREMHHSISADTTTLVDYPNYSAAYALRVLHKTNGDTSLQQILIRYLLDQQFIEHRGFTPDSLAYGGWGFGEPGLKHGEHGHVDVSHTRRVTEALMETNALPSERKEAVILFLKGAQRTPEDDRCYTGCKRRSALPYDGGFISSVVTLETNKSQPHEIDSAGVHYPSYATATCDGFLALNALRATETKMYKDAHTWLQLHDDLRTVEGLLPEDPGQWEEIMHYYHICVRAETLEILDPNGTESDEIQKLLTKEQLSDGSFINPIGGVNKEDDPLMATILAIQALSRI